MAAISKCKYVDFIQDARVAAGAMIVMLYEGDDRMKVAESPYLEYGLADFKYVFDLAATYKYFAEEFLVAAGRGLRNTLLTDLKLYANTYRKFTDKWFGKYEETWAGAEIDDFTGPDGALRSICVENINTLTQLADKMVFVYTMLNSYPVNTDDEIDFNNTVRWTHGGMMEPSRATLYPIPVSALKFIAVINDYRANFNTYYNVYKARYVKAFKSVAANFNL